MRAGKLTPRGHGGGGKDGGEQPLAHQPFHHQFPDRQLAAVVGGHPVLDGRRSLAMVRQVDAGGGQCPEAPPAPRDLIRRVFNFGAQPQGMVAVGPGFEKKDGGQQVMGGQNPDDLPEGRQPPRRGQQGRPALGGVFVDLAVEACAAGGGAIAQQRHQGSRGVQKQGRQGHGALLGLHHGARPGTDGFEPGGDSAGIADGGGKQQQRNARRQVDHHLFPDHPAVGLAHEMGLVQDHEIGVQVDALVHRIVELVAQDLGGSRDQGRLGVFLAVSGEDTDGGRSEDRAELEVLGVGECLEGRGVPGPAPGLEDPGDGPFGDPGLAGPGGGR